MVYFMALFVYNLVGHPVMKGTQMYYLLGFTFFLLVGGIFFFEVLPEENEDVGQAVTLMLLAFAVGLLLQIRGDLQRIKKYIEPSDSDDS